jgi:hypothetical protein
MLSGNMGYLVKVQKVDRPTNRSYYLNLPVVLAETLDITKGEEFQWTIEDKNTLILARSKPKPLRKLRPSP